MDRAVESGLEVKPPAGLEVAAQPDGKKYYTGGGESDHPVFREPDQLDQTRARGQGRSRAVWMLAMIAVVCLTIAIGAGLGAGLAAQHKPSSSRGAPTEASNAPVTITQSDNGTTSTPTPATLPSPICPAANGSTYIATNKPLPTLAPQLSLQITETSLSFEILCNTNFVDEGGPVVDLQIITNVSTLTDCLDACALFNFQTRLGHFPAYACTGIGWGEEVLMLQAGDQWPSCRLKSNVTLESPNGTATYPGYDGAVLLSV